MHTSSPTFCRWKRFPICSSRAGSAVVVLVWISSCLTSMAVPGDDRTGMAKPVAVLADEEIQTWLAGLQLSEVQRKSLEDGDVLFTLEAHQKQIGVVHNARYRQFQFVVLFGDDQGVTVDKLRQANRWNRTQHLSRAAILDNGTWAIASDLNYRYTSTQTALDAALRRFLATVPEFRTFIEQGEEPAAWANRASSSISAEEVEQALTAAGADAVDLLEADDDVTRFSARFGDTAILARLDQSAGVLSLRQTQRTEQTSLDDVLQRCNAWNDEPSLGRASAAPASLRDRTRVVWQLDDDLALTQGLPQATSTGFVREFVGNTKTFANFVQGTLEQAPDLAARFGVDLQRAVPNATISGGRTREPGHSVNEQQSFSVPGLPLRFRYPDSWSKVQSEGTSYVVSGPKGYREIPLQVKVSPVPKSQFPDSSDWKQVIRAQDQLTRQDGELLAMSERDLGAVKVPFVLIGFPLSSDAEEPVVLNVLQFVVDHDQTYYWLAFSGPSDIWESNAQVLKEIFASVQFSDDAAGASAVPKPVPSTSKTAWTAVHLRQVRKKAADAVAVPENAPEGWSKSTVDPQKLVELFRPLRLQAEYRLRAFQFMDDTGNGNGFVWALPATASFPEPEDCPIMVTHVLQPPKPPAALDDFMEVMEGDGTPESYLAASFLARELREFGALWHGLDWTTHVVLDADPFRNPPLEDEEPLAPMDRPSDGEQAFEWLQDRPLNWKPHVEFTAEMVTVTFYTFSGLGRQAIYRHVDYYRPGSLKFTSLKKVVAEAPGGYAF